MTEVEVRMSDEAGRHFIARSQQSGNVQVEASESHLLRRGRIQASCSGVCDVLGSLKELTSLAESPD
jgi:hypothetical protein